MYYGGGWKRPRRSDNGPRRSRKIFPLARLQRATAQIQLQSTGEIVTGRVFLHDLRPGSVGLFLTEPLPRGEPVFFVLEQPRHLFVRGRIEWCGLYRLNTRVLTAENFQYRAAIVFEFDSVEERELISRYLEELAVR